MIIFKQIVSRKEKEQIKGIVGDLDDYHGDFYLTKNNLRLFIKENMDLLFESLKRGDKVAFSNDDGIAIVTGWSDKSDRKYVKVLAKDNNSADRLLKILSWNVKQDMWIKIKKNNPIKTILSKNNFRFVANRGKEILFTRKYLKPEGEKNVRYHKRKD